MKRFMLGLYALTILYVGITVADYTATQGTGTTFGSGVVGGVHYLRNFLCDPTTVTQCVAVNSSGVASVSVSNANANGQATMANSSPVVIASNQTAVPTTLTSTTITGTVAVTESGTWTVQPGNTPNTTSWLMRRNDGTNSEVLDPCQVVAKTTLNIDQAADTQVLSGVSAKKIYVCSITIIAAAAEAVSVVVGTGTVCATNIVALLGSTTDANGMSFAANGGLTLGNGMATVAGGLGANADNVCIRQNATSRISGNFTYVFL